MPEEPSRSPVRGSTHGDRAADTAEAPSSGDLDLDALRARGDVEGLLALARAYRSGDAPGGRDMRRCLDAYRAAAELGSADAEYAVALFRMRGGIVAQDLKEGTTHLRAAAGRGSVPAKVYLGNLYELGIHYKADPEKADVWYRNAARGALIDAEPGSEAHARALADLGCVRYVLALIDSGAAAGDDAARLIQRARAHGYGLRTTSEVAVDSPALSGPAAKIEEADEADERAVVAKEPGPSRAAIGLGAFGYALLFAIAGLGAAYAATRGARELIAHGALLPGLGERTDAVFPLVLGLVGVLPTWLVYRLGTVLKALAIGAFFGGIGWVAWGTGRAELHALRSVQTLAFGLAGFLAALLVLGLSGGTKREPPRPRRRPT